MGKTESRKLGDGYQQLYAIHVDYTACVIVSVFSTMESLFLPISKKRVVNKIRIIDTCFIILGAMHALNLKWFNYLLADMAVTSIWWIRS